MYKGKVEIKETTSEDLSNVMELWNNGNVMFYVGFPNGFGVTMQYLEEWLKGVNQNKYRKHYSVYAEDLGYCGETYYSIDCKNDLATLDIKMLPKAQGKGIAEYSLRYAISKVFDQKLATRAYVDPHPDNKAAWKLYKKLGFISKPRPDFLEPEPTYLEITPEIYNKWGVVAEGEYIILRELREVDIKDDIRWNTIDTKWQLWDAPWEYDGSEPRDWHKDIEREKDSLKYPKPMNRLHSRLEIYINDEKQTHIGSLCHYYIDKSCEYTKEKERCTVGIDICDYNYWGKGLGTKALKLYIQYLFDYGFTEVYTQTWSGNERMVKLAEKLGFKEIKREVGIREVRGKTYDGLTFCLKANEFTK